MTKKIKSIITMYFFFLISYTPNAITWAEGDSNPRTIWKDLANLRVWPLRNLPLLCLWRDLNPHAKAADFKSTTSTIPSHRYNKISVDGRNRTRQPFDFSQILYHWATSTFARNTINSVKNANFNLINNLSWW